MAILQSLQINNTSFIDIIYPIGSIYETIDNSFNPNSAFGGTWTRIKGKFLVGVDENDSSYSSANITGGEKTHTLTVAEMPSHTHNVAYLASSGHYVPQNSTTLRSFRISSSVYTPDINGTLTDMPATGYTTTHFNQSTGGGGSHNNLPPYYSVYIWKREA